MPKQLDGIRVLDLSRLLPGPYLTMVLSDLGADVVKVEEPRIGDYMRGIPPLYEGVSARYRAVNRGKRSLTLDLKSPTDRDAFLRLAKTADVVVESFRPGVLDRLGIGYDELSRRNPRIIVCSISGYGATGSYRERAGHDLGYIAQAGILGMTGMAGQAPAMPGAQIADIAGGALWGLSAILAALFARERTGKGALLDISMTEGALALLAAEFANLSCGEKPTRGEQELNGKLAAYSVYETQDGEYLAVAALEPKFWLRFNEAIGRVGRADEIMAGIAQQQLIKAEVAAILRQKTCAAWMAIFTDVDCCVEAIPNLDAVTRLPLHTERGVFFKDADGALAVRTPLGRPQEIRSAPTLGQHSREVLADYGFSEEEITELLESTK